MWTIFKVFIEFVTVLLLLIFMFWFFGREAYGILAPQPGVEPAPLALEGKVLTTGPPGKSLYGCVFIVICLKVFLNFLFDFLVDPLVCSSTLFSLHVIIFFSFLFLWLISSFMPL